MLGRTSTKLPHYDSIWPASSIIGMVSKVFDATTLDLIDHERAMHYFPHHPGNRNTLRVLFEKTLQVGHLILTPFPIG